MIRTVNLQNMVQTFGPAEVVKHLPPHFDEPLGLALGLALSSVVPAKEAGTRTATSRRQKALFIFLENHFRHPLSRRNSAAVLQLPARASRAATRRIRSRSPGSRRPAR